MYDEKHIMIDIETLGLENDSVILSIAAVKFDITTGEIEGKFYKEIDIESQPDRIVNKSTLKWWLGISSEGLAALVGRSSESLDSVLDEFSKFGFDEGVNVWANSPSFDCSILRDAMLGAPWPYWKERDVRTIRSLAPELKFESVGTHHNALDDCLYQINVVVGILNHLL